ATREAEEERLEIRWLRSHVEEAETAGDDCSSQRLCDGDCLGVHEVRGEIRFEVALDADVLYAGDPCEAGVHGVRPAAHPQPEALAQATRSEAVHAEQPALEQNRN